MTRPTLASARRMWRTCSTLCATAWASPPWSSSWRSIEVSDAQFNTLDDILLGQEPRSLFGAIAGVLRRALPQLSEEHALHDLAQRVSSLQAAVAQQEIARYQAANLVHHLWSAVDSSSSSPSAAEVLFVPIDQQLHFFAAVDTLQSDAVVGAGAGATKGSHVIFLSGHQRVDEPRRERNVPRARLA